ncbi:hypothetical protein C4K04_1577 [Pseudomonas chlororaphis]|uniref:DUF4935 domain-containing protein n=1 Tax=Pseudomonas chlororaphis TaxID=587753 RepID=A0A3G7TJI6_9PSED|nr:PIN domain-containing protein [Pseudomonas chlororaphis]AZE47267.1 hypothetical protein C4K04_1577 [Pseudomonas chlororaphis]
MNEYVLLDSNIYCNDYFARSASFQFLIRYLNNTGRILLIPQVVLEEVSNVHARNIKSEIEALEKSSNALRRLCESYKAAHINSPVLQDYDLLKVISGRVEDLKVVGYSSVAHTEIFSRALHVKRPFRVGEKGYRDTLLWLSMLDFFKSSSSGADVVFINANKSDFYAEGADVKFHPDLQSDLDVLPGLNVRPYVSISSFVSEIDKIEHSIDRVKNLPLFEEYLEDEALDLFESIDHAFLQELDKVFLSGVGLLVQATHVSAEHMEGIEDFDIMSVSSFSEDSVYVACRHDLRVLVLEIQVPLAAYEANRGYVSMCNHFYDIEIAGSHAILKMTVRAYLSANFIFNIANQECSGYSSEILGFR